MTLSSFSKSASANPSKVWSKYLLTRQCSAEHGHGVARLTLITYQRTDTRRLFDEMRASRNADEPSNDIHQKRKFESLTLVSTKRPCTQISDVSSWSDGSQITQPNTKDPEPVMYHHH